MKKLLFLLFFVLLICLGIILIPSSKAQDAKCNNPSNLGLEDISKCLDELNSAKQQSENATKPLEVQINGIKQRVAFIEQDIAVKKKNIDDGYKNLAKQQQILNATIRDYYIKSYYNSPLLILLSVNSASELTQILGYQKANADRDKAIITNIAITINDLQNKKIALENEEASISAIKDKLAVVVAGAKAYQATLSNQISQLSAKQQQILAQRLAGLNIPLYAYNTQGGCSSDVGKDPGFGTKFGFFTYGVPNRVGLNQYGAKGRAERDNQNAEQILKAYYNADYTTGYSTSTNIHVTGTNEYGQSFDDNWSIEDYLKHIYEMPTSWPSEALKAQAIAARSYALAYTNNGANTICPSQQCQVVKREENDDAWKNAVSATAGIVLTNGGNPIKAWFSSTHGGYVFSSSDIGWSGTSWTKEAVDTPSGSVSSFDDLKNNAYDKDSKWFYCDWGSRSDYNKTAWLKPSEVADIVNVIMLMQKDSSVRDHLYQTDKSNPAGTDTWDAGRVKQELQNRGGSPYNNIDNISISADFGSGKVSNVSVSGDAGSNSLSGSDFKNYFNLRAPANIQIVGPLYNVER
jgi:peptidoglycan hydrolase-like amidase/peptidoglycan hydrolase CwlO-like protein